MRYQLSWAFLVALLLLPQISFTTTVSSGSDINDDIPDEEVIIDDNENNEDLSIEITPEAEQELLEEQLEDQREQEQVRKDEQPQEQEENRCPHAHCPVFGFYLDKSKCECFFCAPGCKRCTGPTNDDCQERFTDEYPNYELEHQKARERLDEMIRRQFADFAHPGFAGGHRGEASEQEDLKKIFEREHHWHRKEFPTIPGGMPPPFAGHPFPGYGVGRCGELRCDRGYFIGEDCTCQTCEEHCEICTGAGGKICLRSKQPASDCDKQCVDGEYLAYPCECRPCMHRCKKCSGPTYAECHMIM